MGVGTLLFSRGPELGTKRLGEAGLPTSREPHTVGRLSPGSGAGAGLRGETLAWIGHSPGNREAGVNHSADSCQSQVSAPGLGFGAANERLCHTVCREKAILTRNHWPGTNRIFTPNCSG